MMGQPVIPTTSQAAATEQYDRSLPKSDGYMDEDLKKAQEIERRLGIFKRMYSNGLFGSGTGTEEEWNNYPEMKEAQRLRTRSNLRRGLTESVANAEGLLGDEINLMRSDANSATKTGLQNTRRNYNDRGLLYSGMREGGEQRVRAGVASALSSGSADARREFEDLRDKRKAAIASIGLATQDQALKTVNEAMESSMRSRVARQQAIQQFASGVGDAVGAYYGSQTDPKVQGRPANTSSPY